MTTDYNIEQIELAPQLALVSQRRVAPAEMGAALADMLPGAHAHISGHGGEIVGMPFLRYLAMTTVFEIAAGLPVANPVPEADGFTLMTLPGGAAITTVHFGAYDGVGAAWEAINAWCAAHGFLSGAPGWDVYENDPTQVASVDEIRTRVVCPLLPQ